MKRGLLRVPLEGLAEGPRTLHTEAAAYVVRVHRLSPGDRFVAFDPIAAVEADAELETAGKREAVVRLGAPRPATNVPERRVTLVQGVGKGDKMDAIVRDATELGATRVVPAMCERSVAKPGENRSDRWRRIAVEAARQCGRGDVARVEDPMPLAEALTRFAKGPDVVGWILAPDGATPLREVVARARDAREIVLVVGPEGGLAPSETSQAQGLGLQCVTLGPLVLRTETVCAAVLGALLAL